MGAQGYRNAVPAALPAAIGHAVNRHYADDPEHDYGPTRSQQRRDALAVLELAEQLVELAPTRLARLALPDEVREEIANVRRITSHGARKRQLAYLAKLMRNHDDDAFDAVRAALGENRDRQRQDAAALHRLEALRAQLVGDDGDAALTALIAAHPGLDRQHLRALIRQARVEQAMPGKPPRATRELFQILKALDAEG